MLQRMLAVAAFLCLSGAAACGGEKSAGPGPTVSGNYRATEWVTTGGTEQTNQLNAGSLLSMALASDGTTTGHLHVAASGGNPAFDADMAGTWSMSNNEVTFSQAADTFVRDLTFTLVPSGSVWALTADQVVNGTRIQLTLTQLILVALSR